MQRIKWINVLTSAIVTALPALAAAETISLDMENAFIAPLTVVPDHPQCNGVGEVAFTTEFEADALSYLAKDPADQSGIVVDAAGTRPAFVPRCFVTQMRGVERTQFEVPCIQDPPIPLMFSALLQKPPRLSLSGTITACHAPLSLKFLEASWETTATNDEQVTVTNGTLFHRQSGDCIPRQDNDQPNAHINPSAHGINYTGTRRYPDNSVSLYRIDLFNIPVVMGSGGAPSIHAFAPVFFFATFDGKGTCTDGVCEAQFTEIARTQTWQWPYCR